MKFSLSINILLIATFLISCQKTNQRTLEVDTTWYRFDVSNFCKREIYKNVTGTKESSANCDRVSDLQFLLVDHQTEGIYYRRELEVINQPLSFVYAYRFEVKEEALDSLHSAVGGYANIKKLQTQTVRNHMIDFFHVNIQTNKKKYPVWRALVTDSALQMQHRVPMSVTKYDDSGTSSSGNAKRISLSTDNGSFRDLFGELYDLSGHPVLYTPDTTRYNIEFSLNMKTDDPVTEFRKAVKNRFGIEFVRDSVELPYDILEFQ